jgi:hypothetical protein
VISARVEAASLLTDRGTNGKKVVFDYQMDKLTGDHETTLRKTFRIITAMEGLNELGVEFNGTIGPKPGRKTELLMPLGMVTPTRRFEVKYHGGKRWGG